MHRLTVIPSLAALAIALCATSPASANPGTIAFTWDACDGPIHKTAAAPGIYIGLHQRARHGYPAQGLRRRVRLWRRESVRAGRVAFRRGRVPGLQPGHDPETSLRVRCRRPAPRFRGCAGPSLDQDPEVRPADQPYASTLMMVVLAASYYPGVQSVNPATRYFLGRFIFDHSYSVDWRGCSAEHLWWIRNSAVPRTLPGGDRLLGRDRGRLLSQHAPSRAHVQ